MYSPFSLRAEAELAVDHPENYCEKLAPCAKAAENAFLLSCTASTTPGLRLQSLNKYQGCLANPAPVLRLP